MKPFAFKSSFMIVTAILLAGCSSASNPESGTAAATAVTAITATAAQSTDTDMPAQSKAEHGSEKSQSEKSQNEKSEGETISQEAAKKNSKNVTVLLAAAASLKHVFEDQLIPMFQEKYPDITVIGTYDSSGKLQVQIEEGLEADVFLSASAKQMDALNKEGKIDSETIVNLLENKIVLIVPSGNVLGLSSFEEIAKAEIIALGDPASVPAGQYAKEALTSLGLWDTVQEKASFGTNVTEVLNQVAAGSADAGIVYATDAAAMAEQVEVAAEAPEGSLSQKVQYPAAVLKDSLHPDSAGEFLEFLKMPETMEVFETYGFAPVQ